MAESFNAKIKLFRANLRGVADKKFFLFRIQIYTAIPTKNLLSQYGTHIMSWGPLAEGRNNFFQNETLAAIGAKYGKTVAQVALRWLIQRGVIIIPKSTHIERMRENLDIFDFELSADDMAQIATLDTDKSLFFDHHDGEVTKMFMGWRGLV
jgi:diketogulonate reductase-like aldo/keto reductase